MSRSLGMKLTLATTLLLAGCTQPPVNRDSARPLNAAASVDVQRYLGLWYEIARFPNEFEENCVDVTATYGLNANRTLSVLNSCGGQGANGAARTAEGVARIVDGRTNAKLAVSFFWPFEGDYWILAVADDYSWSLVGEPSGRYLWILARAPRISKELSTELVQKLDTLGYNTAALSWTPQAAAETATR